MFVVVPGTPVTDPFINIELKAGVVEKLINIGISNVFSLPVA